MKDNRNEGPAHITAEALAARNDLKEFRAAIPGCHLHYNGPGDAGFGMKRTCMLLPECAMLMVSPCGCGRSGTVVGEQNDFAKRIFYLCMDDRDIASGRYLRVVPEALARIELTLHPRVILICMTCIDALMGTDLAGLCREWQEKCAARLTSCFMDPIVRESKHAPMVQMHEAIYACLVPADKEPNSMNLLGNFAPLSGGSELRPVLHGAGIRTLRELPACRTFLQFSEMSRAGKNLVLNWQSEAAAEMLQKRLGTPFLSVETCYAPCRAAVQYERIADFLGHPLEYAREQARATEARAAFTARHRGLRIAVGEAVSGNPFEIALTLLEAGAEVPFVFRGMLREEDRPYLAALAERAPRLPIYSGVHPSTFFDASALPAADAVLGLDAGYFCPEAISISWSREETHFGMEAGEALLARIDEALAHPAAHRGQMHGTYLTV